VGVVLKIDGLDADAIAARLRAIFADGMLVERARTAAPGFRGRTVRGASDEMADAVLALVRA
jgi:hypothetical protein